MLFSLSAKHPGSGESSVLILVDYITHNPPDFTGNNAIDSVEFDTNSATYFIINAPISCSVFGLEHKEEERI